MSRTTLLTVTRAQGNNRAITSGEIRPDTADLEMAEVPKLIDGFRRMVRGLEFDVCEMALTTYLCAQEHGVAFTALPVFLVRGFHHGAIHVRADAPPIDPSSLAGTRIGVSRGHTVTTNVWARGVLSSEYGLDPRSVTWVRSGDEHVADYVPPPNVETLAVGTTLLDELASGDLRAVINIESTADTRTLIPEPFAAGLRALRERGHYPINHLVVVRDDVLAAHPDLAADLTQTFIRSKQGYVERLRSGSLESPSPADHVYQAVLAETGEDPLPYGIEPNRPVLQELIGYALDQGILTKEPDLDSLFAEGTRDIVG